MGKARQGLAHSPRSRQASNQIVFLTALPFGRFDATQIVSFDSQALSALGSMPTRRTLSPLTSYDGSLRRCRCLAKDTGKHEISPIR